MGRRVDRPEAGAPAETQQEGVWMRDTEEHFWRAGAGNGIGRHYRVGAEAGLVPELLT